MPNKFDQQHLKNVDKYSKQIDDLYATAIDEVAKLLAVHDVDSLADQKIRAAATKFFNGFNRNLGGTIRNGMKEEWKLANNKGDALVKQVVGNHPDKRYLQGNEDALQSFIGRQRDGLKLSDRVWNLTKEFKDKLEEGLKSGIGTGTGAKLQANDLLQYLNQQQGTSPGTGVYKDPRANARRLTRTETNMAYHEADWERWQQMDFVIGYEVEVSNNGHHCPLCLQLQGKYPKWFKFRSWHPQCYSDDTEVYTNHGWKLFADVTMADQILSLNPDTKNVEWARIVEQVKYFHIGAMLRFHGETSDMLVTPDHPMKYVDYAGEWQEDPAIIATNKQLTISTDGVLHNTIAGVPVHAVQTHYHGNVYDLELDRNHLMYVRRNGKCVWGSNCMCHATAILADDIDAPESDPNAVTQVPAGFAKWVKDNEERSKGRPQPYFVRDNFKGGKLTGGLLKPESMPAVKTPTKNIPTELANYEKALGIKANPAVFELLKEPVPLVTTDKRGAYFSKAENIVNIPIDKRRQNSKWWAEGVLYHEYGHAIDNQLKIYEHPVIVDGMKKLSKNINLKEIEAAYLKKKYQLLSDYRSGKDVYDSMEQVGSIGDTIMSLNPKYGFGHTKAYFKVHGNRQKEFIAHMFENKFIGNAIFKEIAPDLYDEMLAIFDKLF